MKKPRLTPLGETEMEILQHVWDLNEATVGEVHSRILQTRQLAYTTVMTVMKKLADKGYLSFVRDGSAYVYKPAMDPTEVRHRLVRDIVSKVFGGSPAALVQALVRHEEISASERAEIIKLIARLEADDRAGS